MDIKKLVSTFAQRVDAENLPVEAISVYQNDVFVAGRRWVEDRPRNIYSHTKSFTSTAVGLAIEDGFLSLDDKPAEFFREMLPEDAAPQWADVCLRDLLVMGSGVGRALLMADEREKGIGAPDYIRFLFSHDFRYKPGEKFYYSNGNTYLAGRMVEKATGRDLCDFLNERIFAPLEIPVPKWERCPQGHPFGAGGMCLRTDDMLKLGRLYLKKGKWGTKQLVSPEWIQEATKKHVDTPPHTGNDTGLSCGYGYQFWMCPYPGSFRADGKFCQYTIVLPDADAVVGMQCAEVDRFDDIQNAIHQEILSQIH